MKKIISVIFVALFLLTPVSVNAIHFQGDKNLTLPQDKTFNETVFVAAETLTINSPVNGDLFCAGRDVLINAPVAGDVICAAETIKISGKFTGNLRLAAKTIDIGATANGSALIGAQNLTIRPDSEISGDLIAGAETMDIAGKINRDMAIAASSVDFSGTLSRNAKISTSKINYADTAKIGGSLDIYYPEGTEISTPSGVAVGPVNTHQIEKPKTEPKQTTQPSASSWLFTTLWWTLSFLLVGLLLLTFSRVRTLTSVNLIATRPFASFFIGFAVLVFTPIAFFIVLLTILGAPVAFILLSMYFIGLLIASVITSILVGYLIISNIKNSDKYRTPYYYLFLGLPLLWLIMAAPSIGGLVVFISLCLGLGSYFLSFLPSKETTIQPISTADNQQQ